MTHENQLARTAISKRDANEKYHYFYITDGSTIVVTTSHASDKQELINETLDGNDCKLAIHLIARPIGTWDKDGSVNAPGNPISKIKNPPKYRTKDHNAENRTSTSILKEGANFVIKVTKPGKPDLSYQIIVQANEDLKVQTTFIVRSVGRWDKILANPSKFKF